MKNVQMYPVRISSIKILFIFQIIKRNPGSLDRISEEERASFILESNGLKFQSLLEELQKSYTLKDSLKINNNTTQI